MIECPHCKVELPSRECPECLESIPLEGRFCCHCGAQMPLPELATESEKDGSDFSARVLCSDGTCIGVINEKGFCNECGKPYTGEPE